MIAIIIKKIPTTHPINIPNMSPAARPVEQTTLDFYALRIDGSPQQEIDVPGPPGWNVQQEV